MSFLLKSVEFYSDDTLFKKNLYSNFIDNYLFQLPSIMKKELKKVTLKNVKAGAKEKFDRSKDHVSLSSSGSNASTKS